jgi:hypothetical protein
MHTYTHLASGTVILLQQSFRGRRPAPQRDTHMPRSGADTRAAPAARGTAAAAATKAGSRATVTTAAGSKEEWRVVCMPLKVLHTRLAELPKHCVHVNNRDVVNMSNSRLQIASLRRCFRSPLMCWCVRTADRSAPWAFQASRAIA